MAPTGDGRPRVRVSWSYRCPGATRFGGALMLYSYELGRLITSVVHGSIGQSGTRITSETVGPGRYKPQLFGAGCASTAGDEPHVAPGPRVIDGPDFQICHGEAPPRGAASWPVVPVEGGCGAGDRCDARAGTAATADWPVIPLPAGCESDCKARAGKAATAGWPVIPVRQRCGPERLRKGRAPVRVDCPGGAGASRSWPVVPARGPCGGRVELDTARRVPCAAAATAWPVIPVGRCSAVRRAPARLGVARFRLKAGRSGTVPVKLRRGGRRAVRRAGRMPVRATIVMRKGKRRVRTVQTFVLRAR